MHSHAFCNAHSDSGNLAIAFLIANPYARAFAIALGWNSKLQTDIDKGSLNFADKSHDVVAVLQFNNGVANDLTEAMPGDFSATIDINHGSAIERALI